MLQACLAASEGRMRPGRPRAGGSADSASLQGLVDVALAVSEWL